jgi:hypothetical protein
LTRLIRLKAVGFCNESFPSKSSHRKIFDQRWIKRVKFAAFNETCRSVRELPYIRLSARILRVWEEHLRPAFPLVFLALEDIPFRDSACDAILIKGTRQVLPLLGEADQRGLDLAQPSVRKQTGIVGVSALVENNATRSIWSES